MRAEARTEKRFLLCGVRNGAGFPGLTPRASINCQAPSSDWLAATGSREAPATRFTELSGRYFSSSVLSGLLLVEELLRAPDSLEVEEVPFGFDGCLHR